MGGSLQSCKGTVLHQTARHSVHLKLIALAVLLRQLLVHRGSGKYRTSQAMLMHVAVHTDTVPVQALQAAWMSPRLVPSWHLSSRAQFHSPVLFVFLSHSTSSVLPASNVTPACKQSGLPIRG